VLRPATFSDDVYRQASPPPAWVHAALEAEKYLAAQEERATRPNTRTREGAEGQ